MPEPNVKPVAQHLVLPQLKNLEALAAEMQANEEDEDTSTPLTMEALQQAWGQYIQKIDKDTVKNILRQTELKLEGLAITAIVSSALSENTLRQERNLMDALRKSLQNKNITLTIRVDKSKAPPAPKKKIVLTPKQIYLQMAEKNPDLHDLRKKLDLRPE